MTASIGAEWLKLRSVRSFWGYLAAVVAFAGIGTAGTVGSARASDRAAETFIPDLAGLATLSALIALVLGIVVVTGEFRHGTITPTFLATPHRERVLGAKLVFALLGAAALVRARARRDRRRRGPVAPDPRRLDHARRGRGRSRPGGRCWERSSGPASAPRSAPPCTGRSRPSSGR